MKDALAPFQLAGRLVDPSLNRITTASGETAQVEPKIMQVLTVLAETPGAVVSRDELMARVWNGVFVTDDALHRAVRELRRVFGDDAERPRVIETIRKRGYRLIAQVERTEGLLRQSSAQKQRAAAGREGLEGRKTRPLVVVAILVAAAIGAVALLAAAIGRPASKVNGVERAASATEPRMRFTPLTSDPGNEVDPAMSASGRLAYVARGDDGWAHLFTKSSPDAEAVQVTRGDAADHAPAWAPDETQIAFVRIGASGCAIWVAAADGREARSLTPCTAHDEFRMSWSPDGRHLAVTANPAAERAPMHIELLNVADGTRRPLTEPSRSIAGDWSPAFSPDGGSIAFIRSISGSISDIFVAPVDAAAEGAPRRVTTDNADVLGVDWEPDGVHLMFSSDRAGAIGLWRVALAGGEPTFVAGGGGAKLKHPSVSRREGSVAYEEWQYEINLREQSTGSSGSAPPPAAVSPTADRWNFHPQLSPDGRRLVFQSTRSGQYELWLADRDGANARPLTRSAVYKSPARWSPDSRRVALTARFEGRTELFVLDVDTDAVRTVVTDSSNLVAPSWSADGASLYFGSLRTGDWQIWNVNVASGAVKQITADGGYAAIESPDGRSLFVTRLDRRGLWRRPLDGGPETLVAPRVLAEQWPNWGFSERGFYYVSWPDDGDPQLAFLEHGAASPRLESRLPAYAWPGITLSRDARRVIYAHADRRTANIGAVQILR